MGGPRPYMPVIAPLAISYQGDAMNVDGDRAAAMIAGAPTVGKAKKTVMPLSCSDGLKNNDETGVDCGGAMCGACEDYLVCSAHSDCLSSNCDADKMCRPHAATSSSDAPIAGYDSLLVSGVTAVCAMLCFLWVSRK